MKRFILSSLLLTAGALAVHAQEGQIKFQEYDLPNGLHVILHQDHSTPIVNVSVMYHVGSKNEDPNRTGFAHFFINNYRTFGKNFYHFFAHDIPRHIKIVYGHVHK